MNTDTAIGWLIVGQLNEHFPHPEEDLGPWELDDPLGGPFCTVNCGPCGALKWLADNDRDSLEIAVMSTGFHNGGWSWWDDSSNGLRWDFLERLWASHKACGISNGQLIPCDLDETA